jgi:NADH:ubiquinone oxidoreductase subunit F (NADH-binding)
VSAASVGAWAPAPDGVPRLLAAPGAGLDEHVARWGGLPRLGSDLVGLVAAGGLTGRGGGAFPTARKLAAVAERGGERVIVNAVEGEPASAKDRVLLRHVPHLVLDGAVLAAQAVGAREVIVVLGGASELDLASLRRAIEARARSRLDGRVRIRALGAPRTFVAGEETAVVRLVEGGPAKPTYGPRPFERGILVQNVETVANVALLVRFGPEWFRELGTREEPGSVLVTLTEAVGRRGVHEVELGSTFADLFVRAGGLARPLQAVLVGGYFGAWLRAAELPGLRLLDADLVPRGASLGARAVVALPEGACGVIELARVGRYLARESAGQCGPCVHGLAAISDALGRLARREREDRPRLARWLEQVRGRGACRHPDGASRFVASGLDVFADEVDLHLRGRCSGADRGILPVPAR